MISGYIIYRDWLIVIYNKVRIYHPIVWTSCGINLLPPSPTPPTQIEISTVGPTTQFVRSSFRVPKSRTRESIRDFFSTQDRELSWKQRNINTGSIMKKQK